MFGGARVLLLCVSAAAIAGAQTAHPSSPATPPDGFSFEGTWACDGHFGNGKLHRSTYEGSSTLGGSWLQLKEVDLEPAGYQGLYLIGYDKTKGHVVEFDANNFASATYTSDGWKDKSLTLSSASDPDPKALANRFVFRISDATHFSVDWEVNQQNVWRASDHLDCSHEVRS
jgi:hypothetical protein